MSTFETVYVRVRRVRKRCKPGCILAGTHLLANISFHTGVHAQNGAEGGRERGRKR